MYWGWQRAVRTLAPGIEGCKDPGTRLQEEAGPYELIQGQLLVVIWVVFLLATAGGATRRWSGLRQSNAIGSM